jgi:hypothetical protein
LAATFDRVMDPVTTENPANYSTVHGLGIMSASLDSTGRRVYLTTSSQPNNAVDSLVVVNVCDSSGICITTPQQVLYHSGITSIQIVQTPGAGGDTTAIYRHIVTIKGVMVCDTSMTYPNNLFINDTSGPPYNGVLMFLPSYTPYPHFRDTVVVTARVDEYFNATELTDISYFGNLTIVGSGNEPVPHQVTASGLNLDQEGFEGVLVSLCDSFTVTNDSVDAYGFMIRSLSSPNDSIVVHRQAIHTRYSYLPVEGTMITGITGVYRYQREKFRLMPRYDADFNSFITWCGIGPGCVYIPGDINNNGDVNGVDVGYGVNYFKGFGPPPPVDCGTPVGPCPEASPFYAAGDVNANMTFNGVDITYFVNYLKGIGPPLSFPPDCPPAAVAGSSQPETPTLLPRLKSKTSVVRGME